MKKVNELFKKYPKGMMSILMIALTLFVTSCNDDDDDDYEWQQNIVQIAQSDPNLSTLVDAVVAANLASTLSGDGPFTVFAPTNAAFAKLDPNILNNIISTPSLLTALLQYHVVSGEVTSDMLSNGAVPTLLSGQSIDVDLTNGVTLNGSSKVTTADIIASNGVIHIIDEVLLPEDFVAQTIVQIAASNPDFSTLVSILSKPELADLLAAANDPTQDLTVFAPNNAAFDAVLDALGKDSVDDLPVGLLREIVQYHIVGGAVFSDQLTNGDVPTLLENESVTVDLTDGVKINDSNVISADIEAVNGVIHVVDAVLLPSYVATAVGTISEVILFDPNYTILVAALRKAELLNTVSTSDNLTLFAPDNAGFVAAGITSLDGLDKEALTPVLLYHVLGAKVLSSQLPADGMATTLSDAQKIYLGYLSNGVVLINGLTQITAVDIEKSNGVVHKINRTLVPPALNIVEIAVEMSKMSENAEFTVLVSLLSMPEYLGVTEAIINAGNITIFAPTDAAFEAIADVIPTLTVDQITSILQYHAVGARVFSTDLVDGQVVPTLNTQTLKVNITNDGVTLTDKSDGDDANVIEVNVHGSNGVIHVVDKVLLPNLNS
jgi:transforming growth factor-beta-induced protein